VYTDPSSTAINCDNETLSLCWQYVLFKVQPDPSTCNIDANYEIDFYLSCRTSECPVTGPQTINATFTSELFCPSLTINTLLEGSLATYDTNFTTPASSFVVFGSVNGDEARLCLLADTQIATAAPNTNYQIADSFFLGIALEDDSGNTAIVYDHVHCGNSPCPINITDYLVLDSPESPNTFPDLAPNQAGACFIISTQLVGGLDISNSQATTWTVVTSIGVSYSDAKRSDANFDNEDGLYASITVVLAPGVSEHPPHSSPATEVLGGASSLAINSILLFLAVFTALFF